jgi:hypothetical protein
MRAPPRALGLVALLGALLLASLPALATLAVDSQEASNVAHNSATSPLTYSFTNSAGTLFCEGVVVDYANASTGVSISATYNGAAMTAASGLPFKFTNASEDAYVDLFCLEAPATGAHNVSVTVSQTTGTLQDIFGGGISFTGAVTSSPAGTPATNSSTTGTTTSTVNLTGTTNGNWVLSVACTGTSFSSANSPTVLSALKNASGATTCDTMVLGQQSTGGGTATAAFAQSSDDWAIVAAEVFAAAAASSTPQRTLTGVGQ